jgi:hypothetical protein
VTPGVQFAANNFSIFSFGDCSDWKITTRKIGQDSDYIRAAQKPDWYIMQQVFFGGNHKWHTVKTLHYSLPNSAAVFCPVTSRGKDNIVIGWSNMDNSIVQLNQQVWKIQNQDRTFKFYYDHSIGNNWIVIVCPICWQTTFHLVSVNTMKTIKSAHRQCVTIKWDFYQTKSLWAFTTGSTRFKLETDPNIVYMHNSVLQLCLQIVLLV